MIHILAVTKRSLRNACTSLKDVMQEFASLIFFFFFKTARKVSRFIIVRNGGKLQSVRVQCVRRQTKQKQLHLSFSAPFFSLTVCTTNLTSFFPSSFTHSDHLQQPSSLFSLPLSFDARFLSSSPSLSFLVAKTFICSEHFPYFMPRQPQV